MKKILKHALLLAGILAPYTTSAMNPQEQKNLNISLFLAVKENKLDEVKKWIGLGAQINARDEKDCTLLHIITKSEKNQTEILEYVITQRIDIEARLSGFTPLILAASFGKHEVMKILMAQGANLHAKYGNNNILLCAVSSTFNTVNTLKIIVHAGIDVQFRDVDALEYIILRKNLEKSSEAEALKKLHYLKTMYAYQQVKQKTDNEIIAFFKEKMQKDTLAMQYCFAYMLKRADTRGLDCFYLAGKEIGHKDIASKNRIDYETWITNKIIDTKDAKLLAHYLKKGWFVDIQKAQDFLENHNDKDMFILLNFNMLLPAEKNSENSKKLHDFIKDNFSIMQSTIRTDILKELPFWMLIIDNQFDDLLETMYNDNPKFLLPKGALDNPKIITPLQYSRELHGWESETTKKLVSIVLKHASRSKPKQNR